MIHDAIKFIGIAIILLGIIGAFFIGDHLESITSGLIIVVSSIISGFMILGFAAIIESLHNIEMKIVGNPKDPNESEKLKRFRGEYDNKEKISDVFFNP